MFAKRHFRFNLTLRLQISWVESLYYGKIKT